MALEADLRVTLKYAAGVEEHASYTLAAIDLNRSVGAFATAISEAVAASVREHFKTAADYDRTLYGISVEFGYRWRP